MIQTSHVETISLFEYIYRGWPIFVFFVGAIAWLIRLEQKVYYLERFVKELSENVKTRDAAMWVALNEMQHDIRDILQHLAKIEGKLEGHNTHKNQ